MKKTLMVICGLALTLNVFGQEMGTGMLYGDNHSYFLTAPDGWVLDNSSGVNQGLHAVFYPQGDSWKNSSVIMYTNVAHLNTTNQKNVLDVINYDIERFKSASKDLNVEQADSIETTKQHKQAAIYNFLNDSNGNYESVAYIEENKVVVLIIISSRTKEQFLKSYDAFVALVKSYFWISDNVNFQKK